MKEGCRVKEREWGREGGKAEAGDSRLLACVVFPLRDLYTDVVGINFWWTIGTASSPLALSSHPTATLSPLSLSLPLFRLQVFFTHICKLAFLYAALFCFRTSVSPPGTSVSFVRVAERGWGIWDELLFFSFCICFWKLGRDFNLNQPVYTVCKLSHKNCCVFHCLNYVCFWLHVTKLLKPSFKKHSS